MIVGHFSELLFSNISLYIVFIIIYSIHIYIYFIYLLYYIIICILVTRRAIVSGCTTNLLYRQLLKIVILIH